MSSSSFNMGDFSCKRYVGNKQKDRQIDKQTQAKTLSPARKAGDNEHRMYNSKCNAHYVCHRLQLITSYFYKKNIMIYISLNCPKETFPESISWTQKQHHNVDQNNTRILTKQSQYLNPVYTVDSNAKNKLSSKKDRCLALKLYQRRPRGPGAKKLSFSKQVM